MRKERHFLSPTLILIKLMIKFFVGVTILHGIRINGKMLRFDNS